MRAIDRAMAHYNGLARRSAEVPEWSDEAGNPMTVYWRPWTMNQKRTLAQRLDDNDLAYFAEIVILKSEDEAGNKLFDRGDKVRLLANVHEPVLRDLALKILQDAASGAADVEQAEKN